MTSPIVILHHLTTGKVQSAGLDNLKDVYANTVSGDIVIYEGGDVDLGSNNIQLKDGVKWKFIGNPTISSDNANGTFYDNNVAVNVHFEGDVTIENTNGLDKRIVLQNSSSSISGFKWVYRAYVHAHSSSVPTSTIIENTLGGIPTWRREDVGDYTLNLANAFRDRDKCIANMFYTQDMVTAPTFHQMMATPFAGEIRVSVIEPGTSGTRVDGIESAYLIIEVYP